MSTRQYSPASLEAAWQGIDLKAGWAQATFMQETRTTPSWAQKATLNGSAIRTYNADRTSTLSMVIVRESIQFSQLMEAAARDRADLNVVGPLVVLDPISGRTLTYKNAYLITDPDEPFDVAASDITFVWAFESVNKADPTPNANVVGS